MSQRELSLKLLDYSLISVAVSTALLVFLLLGNTQNADFIRFVGSLQILTLGLLCGLAFSLHHQVKAFQAFTIYGYLITPIAVVCMMILIWTTDARDFDFVKIAGSTTHLMYFSAIIAVLLKFDPPTEKLKNLKNFAMVTAGISGVVGAIIIFDGLSPFSNSPRFIISLAVITYSLLIGMGLIMYRIKLVEKLEKEEVMADYD